MLEDDELNIYSDDGRVAMKWRRRCCDDDGNGVDDDAGDGDGDDVTQGNALPEDHPESS